MELNFKTDIKKWLDNQTELLPLRTNFCPNLRPNSTNNAPIKAVIFDIYGTLLISSSGDIDQATLSVDNMSQAIIAGGFTIKENKAEASRFLLDLLPEKISLQHKELKEKGHPFPDVDIFSVWNEMLLAAEKKGWIKISGNESLADTIIVFEILSNKVFPMPGMKEIILELKKKEIPLGIVSNAQFYTPIIMNYYLTGEFSKHQQIQFFEPELSVFSYKELRAKPDVQLFQKLIPALQNKFNIKPSEAVFVGNDMLKDTYTANKAGLQTILFAGDERSLRLREKDIRVKGLFPEYIITELNQLLTIIE